MRNKSRIFRALLALAALARAPDAAAQGGAAGAVHGVVTSSAGAQPVAGVSVRLLELGRSELSHEDGSFHFERIAAGTYRVVATRAGFAPAERTVVVAAGAPTAVGITLTPSVVAIPGLVVTGTGRARSVDEIYRPASVLEETELMRRLGGSVAATLANEPGISQRYNGPAAAQPVIRGLGGDRVLVLEDGQRTGDISSTSGDHAVTVEALTAERIEVLRGPAGLLYGSNALGGVINVVREEVPRTIPEGFSGVATAQAETVNRGATVGGSLLGAVGSVALRGELSGRTADDTRTPLGALPETQVRGYNASAGASWIGGNGFIGAAVRDYALDYGVPGAFNGALIPGAHEEGVTIDLRRSVVRADGAWFAPVGPFGTIEWDAQYVRFEQDEIERSGSVGTSFGQLTASSNLMAHHRHQAGEILTEGTVGVWGLWQDHRVAGSAGSAPAQQRSLAAFAFEELGWESFRLQVGGRFDWTGIEPLNPSSPVLGELRERSFSAFSGSIASLYEPMNGVVLGASLSRAFRTPSIPELFSGGPHLADYSFNIGNPELDPEYGLGADLFARLRLPRVSAEGAVYRNAIENYIYYARTGQLDPRLNRFPVYQARGDEAVLYGAEAQLEWELLDRVVLETGGSYVHGNRSGADEPLTGIPAGHGSVGLRYDPGRYYVSLAWEGTARQDRIGEFETVTPGHSLWDAGVGLRWSVRGNPHTLILQAQNLTDAAWYDHLSRIKEVAPQPGRNVQLVYRASF
ncbi:MAG: TonB-dependent receptor [Gemmatimonadetes bacterium]|nr:TonB-dependent receptor [Gemmatimonadota bacterium]